MIHQPHSDCSVTDQGAISCLSSNSLDRAVVQFVVDNHLWIVEEELRMCIGRPLWFDSALPFLVAEVVRDFARHKAPMKCSAHRIRARARRASQALERALAVHHAENGFVKFSGCETLEAVVGSILQRKRSFYWEELRLPKSLSPRWRY
jgi:hypothetical protein